MILHRFFQKSSSNTPIDHGEHSDSRNTKNDFEPPMNRKRHDILQRDICTQVHGRERAYVSTHEHKRTLRKHASLDASSHLHTVDAKPTLEKDYAINLLSG